MLSKKKILEAVLLVLSALLAVTKAINDKADVSENCEETE